MYYEVTLTFIVKANSLEAAEREASRASGYLASAPLEDEDALDCISMNVTPYSRST